MKNLGIMLFAAIILVLLGTFMVWPQQKPAQPALVISIDDDVVKIQATLTAREAPYLEQLHHLTGTLQVQQTDFNDQTSSWQTKLTQAQNRLDALIQSEEALSAEIANLEKIRHESLTAHQDQLNQLNQQHQTRMLELQSQLEAETNGLSALNARLQSP